MLRIALGITIVASCSLGFSQVEPLREVHVKDFKANSRSSAGDLLRTNSFLARELGSSSNFVGLKASKRKLVVDNRTFYILEGDLLVDEDELKIYAKTKQIDADLFAVAKGASKFSKLASFYKPELIIDEQFGKPVAWKEPKNITYSIAKVRFSNDTHYADTVRYMSQACRDWEATCGVKFIHRADLDDRAHHYDGSGIPIGVTFVVQEHPTAGDFVATAFFPNDPGYRRKILVDRSYFADGLEYDRIGVLRHELGHVLGFRHEHIRSGAPAECPGESSAAAITLTDYNPSSVMHYFCGGVGDKHLRITPSDMEGAQKIYGAPLSSVVLAE
jgi:hypothetical protein